MIHLHDFESRQDAKILFIMVGLERFAKSIVIMKCHCGISSGSCPASTPCVARACMTSDVLHSPGEGLSDPGCTSQPGKGLV